MLTRSWGCLTVNYWEKEGAHHQGNLHSEGEHTGEKNYWESKRDRIESVSSQMLKTLKQRTSSIRTKVTGKDLFVNSWISILSQSEFLYKGENK